MANLKDIIAYILQNYPSNMKHELSNARVTKMVYLADWRNCLQSKGQVSDIEWYFDNFGPFVWDVKKAAEEFPEIFDVGSEKNMYGSTKTIFRIKDDSFKPDLTKSEKKSIDFIIGVSSKKYWDNFIKLVYSTHPIASSERYSYLNLGEKAAEYRELKDAQYLTPPPSPSKP